MRVACAVHTPKIGNSIKLHACSKITLFRVQLHAPVISKLN